jgi:hypothetical protein
VGICWWFVRFWIDLFSDRHCEECNDVATPDYAAAPCNCLCIVWDCRAIARNDDGKEECFTLPNVGQPHPLLNIPQEEKLTTTSKAVKKSNLFFFMIKRCR